MERTNFISVRFFAKVVMVAGMVLFFGVASASAVVKVGFVDMQKAITATKSFKKEMAKYQTSYKGEQKKFRTKKKKSRNKKMSWKNRNL